MADAPDGLQGPMPSTPNLLPLHLSQSLGLEGRPSFSPPPALRGLVEAAMNQHLKHSEESRSRTPPCKYTASPPATSRINTQLIYLLPVKETAIIIFALQAAASCVPSGAPPCSHEGLHRRRCLPAEGPPVPPPPPAALLPWEPSRVPQITICGHKMHRPAVHVRPQPLGGSRREWIPRAKEASWKANSAENWEAEQRCV